MKHDYRKSDFDDYEQMPSMKSEILFALGFVALIWVGVGLLFLWG